MRAERHVIRVAVTPLYGGGAYTTSLNDQLDKLENISLLQLSRLVLLKRRIDVIHVHWETTILGNDNLWTSISWLFALSVARFRRAAIVYTVHNIEPHEAPLSPVWSALRSVFDLLVSGLIFHHPDDRPAVISARPRLSHKEWVTIPHPHLRVHGPPVNKLAARRRLGIDRSCVLFVIPGVVRKNKQIDVAIRLLCNLGCETEPSVELLVAGQPTDDATRVELERLAAPCQNTELRFGGLTDAALVDLICASDAVVCLYSSALTSGTAHLALSYDRPVVGLSRGSLPNMEHDFGPEWFFLTDQVDQRTAEDWVAWIETRRPSQSPRLTSWPEAAYRTRSFYFEEISRLRPLRAGSNREPV